MTDAPTVDPLRRAADVERQFGGAQDVPQTDHRLMQPLGYEPFVALMAKSTFILTDSGGVQEEAPSLGKPVLVMRDKTERTEGLDGGVRLVGTNPDRILAEAERLLTDDAHYREMAEANNPYGDGSTSEHVVRLLSQLI